MKTCMKLAVAFAVFAAVVAGRALVVSGASDKILFSHEKHLARQIDCAKCHTGTPTDHTRYQVLPPKAACAACHDVKTNCGRCHTDPVSPKGWGKVARKGIFLHSVHKDSIVDCKKCHLAVGDAKPSISGNHKICGECHEEHIKEMMCAKCHYDMVFAGLNKLNQFKHDNHFMAEHGVYAKRSVRVCSQCHSEAYCTDCHSKKAGLKVELKYPEAVKRGFIHRGDYLTLHRFEAKTDSADCLKCHATAECAACHKKDRASPLAKSPFFGHPAGWMSKSSANFHGDEAKRDIVGCAACHHAEGPGYCITCHKTQNPHPKGWENRASGLDRSSKMCAKCHGK